jgi:hypothetical protein
MLLTTEADACMVGAYAFDAATKRLAKRGNQSWRDLVAGVLDSEDDALGVNAGHPDIESTVALLAAFPQFQKPDPDSFVANSSGRAFFAARVAGNLLTAQSVQVWVVYHFDGSTYGPVPNNAEANSNCQRSSYGIDAMRQS